MAMTMIVCRSLDGGLLQSNEYATPKGNSYMFHRGRATDVRDKDDAAHFLSCIHYEEVGGPVRAIKEAITKSDEKKKEAAKLTEKDVYALNKSAQRELIRKLGGGDHRVPYLEKDRVALILKLQEEG